MASPELLRIPFSRKLIRSSITPDWHRRDEIFMQKQLWRFQELEGMPEKVIRMREYLAPHPEIEVRTQQDTKISLDKAREYGIPIPDVEMVIGPSWTDDYLRVYTIVDKIHGYELGNLHPSIPFPITELDNALSRIVKHSIHMEKKGMPIFYDFDKPGEMFMYGRRKDDMEDKLWVVDIDLGPTKNWQIFYNSLADIFKNICGAFSINSKEYPKLNLELIKFFRSINKTDKDYAIMQAIFKMI